MLVIELGFEPTIHEQKVICKYNIFKEVYNKFIT